jgi:hypothetical protein
MRRDLLTSTTIRTRTRIGRIFQWKNPLKGQSQSKNQPKIPPIAPNKPPKTAPIIPITTPNTPAIIPNVAPARPIQMGKVKITISTISSVEVELLDCIIVFSKPYQKPCGQKKSFILAGK